MRAYIKNILKSQLERRNRHLVWFPEGEPSGLNLEFDLKLLVAKDNPVIFDIGANKGQSIEMFLSAFKKPQIYSFEPSSECFDFLRDNFEREGVVLCKRAIGATQGSLELKLYEKAVMNSFLEIDSSELNRFKNISVKGVENVEVSTVDLELNSNCIKYVDLLKIDTQGFDFEVLKGGVSAFKSRRISFVQIELNFMPMYRMQAKSEEISAFLLDFGFSLVDYYEKFRQGGSIAWCTALFKLI